MSGVASADTCEVFGIPEDFDPGMFVGRTLQSVTFAEHLIGLSFDPEPRVSVYGSVGYRLPGMGGTIYEEASPAESALPGLVGLKVVAGAVTSPLELTLRLERGGLLLLLDDQPRYEAFTIDVGERTIVV